MKQYRIIQSDPQQVSIVYTLRRLNIKHRYLGDYVFIARMTDSELLLLQLAVSASVDICCIGYVDVDGDLLTE